jgi:hypothetical protein
VREKYYTMANKFKRPYHGGMYAGGYQAAHGSGGAAEPGVFLVRLPAPFVLELLGVSFTSWMEFLPLVLSRLLSMGSSAH